MSLDFSQLPDADETADPTAVKPRKKKAAISFDHLPDAEQPNADIARAASQLFGAPTKLRGVTDPVAAIDPTATQDRVLTSDQAAHEYMVARRHGRVPAGESLDPTEMIDRINKMAPEVLPPSAAAPIDPLHVAALKSGMRGTQSLFALPGNAIDTAKISIAKDILEVGVGGLVTDGYDPAGLPIQHEVTADEFAGAAALAQEAGGSLAQSQATLAERNKPYADDGFSEQLQGASKGGWGELLSEIVKNPGRTAATFGPESFAQFAPALATTMITKNPALAAGATFANSGGIEYAGGITQYLQSLGIDPTDTDAVQAALSDPKVVAEAVDFAKKRALIVGGVDAATAGIASKTIAPARLAARPLVREATNLGAHTVLGAAAGAGGEKLAQEATGQDSKLDVALEGILELAQSPTEVAPHAIGRVLAGGDISHLGTAELKDTVLAPGTPNELRLRAAMELSARGEGDPTKVADFDASPTGGIDPELLKAGNAALRTPAPVPTPTVPNVPPPVPTPEQKPAEGVPVMITQAMRKQLADRGYTPEQIGKMTPADAHAALTPDPTDLTPREPAPAQVPADATREQLVAMIQSAPTPEMRAHASGVLAAYDATTSSAAAAGTPTNPEQNRGEAKAEEGTGQKGPEEQGSAGHAGQAQAVEQGQAVTDQPVDVDRWRRPAAPAEQTDATQVNEAGLVAGQPAAATDVTRIVDAHVSKWIDADVRGTQEVPLRDASGNNAPAAEVAQVFKDVFGLDTKVLRFAPGSAANDFNGFTRIPGAEGIAFINERSDDPFLTVVAHEFGHDLRRNAPDIYDELVDKLRNNGKLSEYIKHSLGPRLSAREYGEMPTHVKREEMISDTWQILLADKRFIDTLAAEEPALFTKFRDQVVKWLDSIMAKLRGAGHDATKYYADVEAMREHFKNAAVAYARRQAGTESAAPGEQAPAASRGDSESMQRAKQSVNTLANIHAEFGEKALRAGAQPNPMTADDYKLRALLLKAQRDRGNDLSKKERDRLEGLGYFDKKLTDAGSDKLFELKQRDWIDAALYMREQGGGKYIIPGDAEYVAPAKPARPVPVEERDGKHFILASRKAPVLRNLTEEEQARISDRTAQTIVDKLTALPSKEEMAAIAVAGQAKRGWYARSAEAISAVFGPDAPRFAALLAALSPQTSVESNLRNALNTWANWVQAGRPTDRQDIIDIMGRSVEGDGGVDSVLNAWINNSVSALSGDAAPTQLSGPKVSSFMRNLLGNVHEVTNDAWMAAYANVDASLFKGTNKTAKQPYSGKSAGYMAMSAQIRAAATYLTRHTGEVWTPAEVQETIWSWSKTLTEMADAAGEIRTPQELVADRAVTDELIASTPDFSTLFADPEYASILEDAGHGEQLQTLRDRTGRDAARQPGEEPGAGRKAGPFAEATQLRHEARAAGRLDRSRNADRQAVKPRTQTKSSIRAEEAAVAAMHDEDYIPFSRKNPPIEPYGENEGDDLTNLPSPVNIPGRGRVAFHGFKPAQEIAEKYAGKYKQPLPTDFVEVDEARAKRIADAYEQAKHQPDDAETKRAYAAMIDETIAQYRDILATGLTVEPITGEDPYAATPRLAILDVVESNHLWFFPTDAGFGSSAADVSDNPLLAQTEFKAGAHTMLANDVFRVVHDYFGHIANGVGFRADGEENAWREHSAMYSPLARRAMTSETRGQNSWVNYGPHGAKNRNASSAETTYADQKTTLLPEWVSNGDEAPVASRKGFNAKPVQPDAITADAYHYSNQADLTELDPAKAGSAGAGRERKRFGMGVYGRHGGTAARVAFYVREPGAPVPQPEDVVRGHGGQHPYRVTLTNLYDGESDPRNLVEDNSRNPDAMEEAISDAGFDGFYMDAPGGGIDTPVAVVFDIGNKKIPVEPVEEPVMASRKPVFRSALVDAVNEGKGAPKKADATAWKQWLDGAQRRGEIKQGERDWIGVDAWLDGRGTTTRQELADYVAANQVQLEETELGERKEPELPPDWRTEYDGFEWLVFNEKGRAMGQGSTEAEAVADAMLTTSEPATKFQSYQLPGGENYRELLLQLPWKPTANDWYNKHNAHLHAMHAKYGDGWRNKASAEDLAEDARLASAAEKANDVQQNFSSAHFDQHNILAHVRYNERTDSDGKKVLFLEEIQSDWHQAGRKGGYQQQMTPALQAEINDLKAKSMAKFKEMKEHVDDDATFYRLKAERDVFLNRYQALENGITNGVPDAPFKATDEWAMLAVKRMVREAAERGFDRIAWTTGDQQAERYDLSKQIETLLWQERTNGNYDVKYDAVGRGGTHDMGENIPPEKLEDYVGKETAQKIIDGKGRPAGGGSWFALTGVDLKVGGEGMRGFYDKVLPSAVNKWAKRFGGRVGSTNINKPRFMLVEKDGRVIASGFSSREDANERNALDFGGQAEVREVSQGNRVHALDVTPAMKAAALEGMPLFSRRTPADARQQRAQYLGQLAAQGFPQGSPTQPVPGGKFAPLKEALDTARVKLQDKMIDVRRLQERAGYASGPGQTSITLDDAMNAYRLENLMHGRVKDQLEAADREFILKLQERMKRLGVTVAQMEDYLLARAAPERNVAIAKINPAMPDSGSGISTQQATRILVGAEPGPYSGEKLSAQTIAHIKGLLPLVDGMRERAIDNMVRSGQMTPALAAALRAKYPNYVPMRGKQGEATKAPGQGKGLSIPRSMIKRALGRGQDNLPQNILGELAGDLQRSIVAAEKSRAGQAFLRFALAHPDDTLYKVEPVDLEWKFSEATGEAYLGVKSAAEDADTTMIVMHDGKPVRIRFMDERLGDAVMNMSANDMGALVKYLGAINRWRSAVLTRFNPGFTPINVLRDLLFGIPAIAGERGIGAAAKAVNNYVPALYALADDAQGRQGDASVPDAQKTTADWVREYSESGAKTGMIKVDDVVDLQRKLSIGATTVMQLAADGKPFAAAKESLKRALEPLAGAIELVNDATENALRASAYISMRKAGNSIEKSAEYAKNLTINFNRKGQWGPALGSLYLFYNAAMQGAHATQRVLRNPKVQGFVGALAGLQFMLALSMMGDDDDDGVTPWDMVPDYVKRTSLVIPLGGLTGNRADYFALPMPYGVNVFVYSGSRLAQRYGLGERETDTSYALDLVKSLTEAFSPVPLTDGYGSLFGDQVGFAMQLAANEDDLGRRIAQEDPYAPFASPKALHGRPDTARPYHVAAQLLARLGGADLEQQVPPIGFLDVAPEQLEAVTDYVGGGLGSLFTKGFRWWEQTDAGNFAGAMDSIAATPIAGRLIGEGKAGRAIADRYYRERERIERNKAVMQGRIRKGEDPEKALAEAQAEHPELTGLVLDRYKKRTKGHRRGEVKRTETGAAELKASPGTPADELKIAEKAAQEIGAAIRNVRDPETTNAQIVAIFDAVNLPGRTNTLTVVGLPENYVKDVVAPNRVRQRAIKALQDAREYKQKQLLRSLSLARRVAKAGAE